MNRSCSFCGRPEEVAPLIAGPAGIAICQSCVETYSSRLAEQVPARTTCSFCGTPDAGRADIVRGPEGAAICSDCLALCWSVLDGDAAGRASDEGQGAPRPEHPVPDIPAGTRTGPPGDAVERETLQAFLDRQRNTMVWKLDGLDRDSALREHVPSGTTLLGMLKHLAYVERTWFRSVLAGEDVSLPRTEGDPRAGWRIEEGDTVESIVAFYRDECAAADRSAARYGLDDVAGAGAGNMSLRRIMLHMIEETARHCGQADILRELTDGRMGE